MPGGKYSADQNPDGTWNVRGVPVVVEAEIPVGEDGTATIDKEWMKAALAACQRRLQLDKYLPPLHVNHHGSRRDVRNAGRFSLKGIRKGAYEGQERHQLIADLLHVPKEIYAELRAGRLPYLSAEIHDVTKPEIDSVALMADTVPFFRLPNLTIGRERPAANLEAFAFGVRAARRPGAAILMATGGGAVIDDPREAIKAAAMAAFSDAMEKYMGAPEEDAADLEVEPAEDDAAELEDEIMEDSPPPEISDTMPAEQEPEIDIDLADEDDDGEVSIDLCGTPKDPLEAAKASARTEGKYAAALAASKKREAKLEARLAAIETKDKRRELVAWAKRELAPYGLIELDAKVDRHVAKGEAVLRAFVETIKEEKPLDPPTSWTGEAPVTGIQTADAAFLQALPSNAHDKAQQFAREWREAREAGYPGRVSLEDHVKICLQAEGLMAGHPDPRS